MSAPLKEIVRPFFRPRKGPPVRSNRFTTVRPSKRRPTGDASKVANRASFRYSTVMKRDEAVSRLKAHEADLRKLGVERLFLFGSTARDEAGDAADVDLFFDYQKGKFGLFELMEVKAFAADILGRRTDIMTRDSLHKTLRRQIEETAVRVF